tara:strand:- start:6542 stop:6904 length:363 start_codon:yes stop_codon:yes gene_type:complete
VEHKVWCVCNGEGWVWGHELPHDADYVTDTRYPCPYDSVVEPDEPPGVEYIYVIESRIRSMSRGKPGDFLEWRAEGSFNDRQDAIMEVERRAARWDGAEFIAREAEYRVVDVVDSEASFK